MHCMSWNYDIEIQRDHVDETLDIAILAAIQDKSFRRQGRFDCADLFSQIVAALGSGFHGVDQCSAEAGVLKRMKAGDGRAAGAGRRVLLRAEGAAPFPGPFRGTGSR
jgi:hypothetical protein